MSNEWRRRVLVRRSVKVNDEYTTIELEEKTDTESHRSLFKNLKAQLDGFIEEVEGRTPKPQPPPPSPSPTPRETRSSRGEDRGEEPRATPRQMRYLKDLCEKHKRSIPMNISKREASRLIKELAGR